MITNRLECDIPDFSDSLINRSHLTALRIPNPQTEPSLRNFSKRITIVCDLLSTFVRFRLPLAMEMIRRGHSVRVVGSRRDDEATAEIRAAGIDVELVPMERTGLNPVADFRYWRMLVRRLADLQPDVLFAYQAKAAVYSHLAAASFSNCSRHVLFPGLGFLFSDSANIKKRLLRRAAVLLYRRAFRDVDTAFFQNSDDLKTLETYRILKSSVKRVIVNGSGVPLDVFEFCAPAAAPIRFTMATRLLRPKGVCHFAEAAKVLKAKYGDAIEFDLLGPVDSNPNAVSANLVSQWIDAGFLQYHGAVKDVRPFLKQTSVFVLPSFYMEGTPRSILEAMATGRAIITSDFRGCRDTVVDGVNGYLVTPQSTQSLVEAMTRFIEKPDLIAPMGQASRRMAEEKYDVNDVVDQMLRVMGL